MKTSDDDFRGRLETWLAQPVLDDPLSRASRAQALDALRSRNAWRHMLDDLTAPQVAELDLHLGGSNVVQHQVPGDRLGAFIRSLSQSINESADEHRKRAKADERASRSRGEKARKVPAPRPVCVAGIEVGSLRVKFQEPLRQEPDNADVLSISVPRESHEAVAMRDVSRVFANASDMNDLRESLQVLPFDALGPLARASGIAVEDQWSIEGALRKRGWGVLPLAVDVGDLERIHRATLPTEGDARTHRQLGRIDGWIWSSGLMRFKPSGKGEAIDIHVADPGLQRQCGQLNAGRDRAVRVAYIELWRPSKKDAARLVRRFELQSIAPRPPDPAELDFE